MRQLISSGSPYEPKVGISRAVRVGSIVAISGTARSGRTAERLAQAIRRHRPANTVMQVSGFIDPDWLVEFEADAVVEEPS